MTPPPTNIPRYSLALLSATALAYEILLMRLFSIIQWHHFAYMIISLALLGYAASGAFLSLARARLLARFPLAYAGNMLLFGLSSLGCFLAAQQIPFNAQEVLWDARQGGYLLAQYLLLALPFFFAANAIGLALMRYPQDIARLYAADLLGAGAGGLGIVLLLFAAFPDMALRLLSAMGLLSAALACRELRLRRRTVLWIGITILVPLALPAAWTALILSPYKELSQTLQVMGARSVAERSSPLGLLSVVESPLVPLRHAPGLSLNATTEPPEQLAVFTDGDAMTVITRLPEDPGRLAYLDQLTAALPYHLGRPRRVLVLGAGGGSEVLQARYQGAAHIDAVELNPQLVALLREDYADFSGHLYDSQPVQVHIAEARGFVAGSGARYDLIQMAMLDSFSASAAGLYALSESYLYTVEALQDYLDRLADGGLLAITRWVKLPPRDTLKLFATAVEALRRRGHTDIEQRLVLIRSWQTSTLLVKNGRFSPAEIRALQHFCARRSFDLAYYPGMPPAQANRYNRLPQPYFHQAALALLGGQAGAFLADYKFDLRPATDDRPFFFRFFKWNALPEILELRGRGGMPLLEWGYLVLVATLLQALLLGALLILLPLWLKRTPATRIPPSLGHARVFGYFFALGLAFLFVEIAFLQKFLLFLYHPLYTAAVVLAAFLLFAGLGSRYAQGLAAAGREVAGIRRAISALVALGLLYLLLLGPLFALLAALPLAAKVTVAIGLIAPLAFCMGMPFPLGLSLLGERAPQLLPWVWGVNGGASVLSAVLATLLAIHFGFTAVVLLALALYGAAAFAFGTPVDRQPHTGKG